MTVQSTLPRPSRVVLEAPSAGRRAEFLRAVARSRSHHRHFAQPASTAAAYRALVARSADPRHVMHFVCTPAGELAGVINISEIVRGAGQFGYLGYYAFVPHAGRGYMRQGLIQVLRLAFGRYGLHRVEANIQPDNARSIALVASLGFRKEGFSPRYLKLKGRWRDHERWACTHEDFRSAGPHARTSRAGARDAPV